MSFSFSLMTRLFGVSEGTTSSIERLRLLGGSGSWKDAELWGRASRLLLKGLEVLPVERCRRVVGVREEERGLLSRPEYLCLPYKTSSAIRSGRAVPSGISTMPIALSRQRSEAALWRDLGSGLAVLRDVPGGSERRKPSMGFVNLSRRAWSFPLDLREVVVVDDPCDPLDVGRAMLREACVLCTILLAWSFSLATPGSTPEARRSSSA